MPLQEGNKANALTKLKLVLLAAPEAEAMHALTTKLALAREFLAIGDKDGARAMAQEVADHATGELQAEARKFVQEIA